MFRWLKDRSRKSRKSSTDSEPQPQPQQQQHHQTGIKELDDYGFKQKHDSGESKRDLPPTPVPTLLPPNVTDDDKSLHIYEEIPDLPFRCTPEGELRISLAREQASRQAQRLRLASSESGQGSVRNISPYMVVPVGGLAPEGHLESCGNFEDKEGFPCGGAAREEEGRETTSADASKLPPSFQATHEAEGAGCSAACCEGGSQGASSPSCCGSSVFGSPLEVLRRCESAGGDGGDMSERLLSAINLTRLLAAVRLSSSSADTCTTSPICIGVDKDGRNISVSVSVTPTSHHSLSLTHPSHPSHPHPPKTDARQDPLGGLSHGYDPESSCHRTQNDTDDSIDPRNKVSDAGKIGGSGVLVPHGNNGSVVQAQADSLPPHAGSTCSGPQSSFQASLSHSNGVSYLDAKHQFSTNRKDGTVATSKHRDGTEGSTNHKDGTGSSAFMLGGFKDASGNSALLRPEGLRFLPSPQEQSALSEILQLKPGERTELDPATIDALILRLCSTTLQTESSPLDESAGPRAHHRQQLEDVEKMLKDMVKVSEGQGHQGQGRLENSDTGYEYDASTASSESSDQASYDYFLSKVTRTRNLECQVKKLIDTSPPEEDSEEEGEGGSEGGESFSTLSTISPTSLPQGEGREKESANDSDEGTMADLSESENSSGYYEYLPGLPRTALPAAQSKAVVKGHRRVGKKKRGAEGEGGAEDIDLPCFELQEEGSVISSRTDGSSVYASFAAPKPLSSHKLRHHYSKIKTGPVLGKKSRHHHYHQRKSGKEKRSLDDSGGSRPSPYRSVSLSDAAGHWMSTDNVTHSSMDAGLHAAASLSQSSLLSLSHSPTYSLSHPLARPGAEPKPGKRRGTESVYSSSLLYGSSKADGDRPYSSLYYSSSSTTSGGATTAKPLRSKLLKGSELNVSSHRSKTSSKDSDPVHAGKDGDRNCSLRVKSSARNNAKDADLFSSLRVKSCKSSKDLNASLRVKSSRSKDPEQRVSARFKKDSDVKDSDYRSRQQLSEVYALPSALPDSGSIPGAGVRGMKGSLSVPSKLSVARQVPESSEVYGTRAGLQGCNNNRLLSDLIMMNYNRQVFNM